MKKTSLAPIALLAALATPLQATASPPGGGTGPEVVERDDVSGEFAEVVWEDASTGAFGVVYANESDDLQILQLQTVNRDGDGTVIGYTDIYADANLSPYGSLQIDKSLTTATFSATDVPAQKCEYDANFEFLGCEFPVPIDAQATFTGVGEISREPAIFHTGGEGFVATFHSTGPSRQATATGAIEGMTFTDDQVPLTCDEGQGTPVCGLISRNNGGSIVVRPDVVRPDRPLPGEIDATYLPDSGSGCTGTFVIDYAFSRVDETFALTPSILHQWLLGPDDTGYEVFEQYTPLPEPVTKGTYHFEVPVTLSDGDPGTSDMVQVAVWHALSDDIAQYAPIIYYDVTESEGTCTLSPGDGVFGDA